MVRALYCTTLHCDITLLEYRLVLGLVLGLGGVRVRVKVRVRVLAGYGLGYWYQSFS